MATLRRVIVLCIQMEDKTQWVPLIRSAPIHKKEECTTEILDQSKNTWQVHGVIFLLDLLLQIGEFRQGLPAIEIEILQNMLPLLGLNSIY